MSIVFVDTVGLLALWNDMDQWHGDAGSAFLRAYERRDTLLTTTCVLLECGNALARTPRRDLLLSFRIKLLKSQQLIEPLPEDFDNAWNAFTLHAAADAGIIDLVSFQVMRRLGISEAITNDQHFRAAGFTTLM